MRNGSIDLPINIEFCFLSGNKRARSSIRSISIAHRIIPFQRNLRSQQLGRCDVTQFVSKFPGCAVYPPISSNVEAERFDIQPIRIAFTLSRLKPLSMTDGGSLLVVRHTVFSPNNNVAVISAVPSLTPIAGNAIKNQKSLGCLMTIIDRRIYNVESFIGASNMSVVQQRNKTGASN